MQVDTRFFFSYYEDTRCKQGLVKNEQAGQRAAFRSQFQITIQAESYISVKIQIDTNLYNLYKVPTAKSFIFTKSAVTFKVC